MQTRVDALPLFPLNVVLFPGQPLPLHIFEHRYRAMIRQCIENNEAFGVLLAIEHDVPDEIGTTTRVTEVKKLPDGRMDIMTLGEERFKLNGYHVNDQGFLVGQATLLPFDPTPSPALSLVDDVSKLTRKYLHWVSEIDGVRFRIDSFPTTPRELALFTAIALRLPLEMQQELLCVQSIDELLRFERDILSDENRFLQVTASAIRPPEDDHGFSRN
jgi:ATP-dependent Lon protease